MYRCRPLSVMLFVFTYIMAAFSFSEEEPLALAPEKFIERVNYLNAQTQLGLNETMNALLGGKSYAPAPPATSAEKTSQTSTSSQTATTVPESNLFTTTSAGGTSSDAETSNGTGTSTTSGGASLNFLEN